MKSYGVGFLGSGPVAQAIHVPFIRNFPGELHPAYFMDVAADLAEKLAVQHECKWTVNEDELINDPDIDVVVIGSPNNHHARQIIKSCRAGKLLVLAEKPLAISTVELQEIRQAAQESGTHIVVGTMHAFDEAYAQALIKWRSLDCKVLSIEVNCYLPTNDEFVDRSTQLIRASATTSSGGQQSNPTPPTVKELITGAILGLAMHDIPAIRDFAPADLNVSRARYVTPWGYLIEGQASDIAIRILAQLPGEWSPDWSFTVTGDKSTMHVQYQPSYVDSGSSKIIIRAADGETIFRSENSPYTSEWQEVLNLLNSKSLPIYDLERISADLNYALNIIGQMNDGGI